MSRRAQELPTPGVAFSDDFLRRVEALLLRLSAARELREGAGSASLLGHGEEFSGYRPYRPGEDLRQLDWSLFARLDRPFVRVTRREAGETWAVLLDASASMGVGPPGKLQRAAECALALSSLGLRFGARVRLLISGEAAARELNLRTREDVGSAHQLLAELQAAGTEGLAQLLRGTRRLTDCGRVFLLGDLFDVEARVLTDLRRGSRQVFAMQLLAPQELAPELGARRWWDPESEQELELDVDGRLLAAYEARLEAELEAWRDAAVRHGMRYTCRATTVAFEDLVRELVGA